jgi:hypothetical protein
MQIDRTIERIRTEVTKAGRRSSLVKMVSSKMDKDKIAGWRVSLDRTLHVFNVSTVLASASINLHHVLRPSSRSPPTLLSVRSTAK